MYTSAAPLRARSGGVSQNDALRFDVLPVFDVIRIGGPPVLATCSRPGGRREGEFRGRSHSSGPRRPRPFCHQVACGASAPRLPAPATQVRDMRFGRERGDDARRRGPRISPHRLPRDSEPGRRFVACDPPRRYSRVRVPTCFSVEYAPPNMTFRRIPRRGPGSSVFFRPASRAGPIIASFIFPLHLGCSKEIPRERR